HPRRRVHMAEERDQRVGERGVHHALTSGAQGSGAARPCAGAVLAGGGAAGGGVGAGAGAGGWGTGGAGGRRGRRGAAGSGVGVGTLALLLMSWIAAESAKRSSGKVSLAKRTVTWPVRSARMLIAFCAFTLTVFTMTLVAPNGLRPAVPLMLPLVTLFWSNLMLLVSLASMWNTSFALISPSVPPGRLRPTGTVGAGVGGRRSAFGGRGGGTRRWLGLWGGGGGGGKRRRSLKKLGFSPPFCRTTSLAVPPLVSRPS